MEESIDDIVKLRSGDGRVFDVSRAVATAAHCELIKDSPEDNMEEGGSILDIPRATGDSLNRAIEYMEHFQVEPMNEIPTPLGGISFDEIVTQQWYRDFVGGLSNDSVFDLVNTANFLSIRPLLDLACLKVTFLLSGKSAEEIREMLRLPELSPEEEAAARTEHAWLFQEN